MRQLLHRNWQTAEMRKPDRIDHEASLDVEAAKVEGQDAARELHR